MNALNSILIEGDLIDDPVTKETPRGSTVCTFSIASSRFYKQDEDFEEEVSHFDIESWGKIAERCKENLAKDLGVRVVGRLKQERWTDDEGKAQSKIKVVAEHIEYKPRLNKAVTHA